jgi:hypothetical protein
MYLISLAMLARHRGICFFKDLLATLNKVMKVNFACVTVYTKEGLLEF